MYDLYKKLKISEKDKNFNDIRKKYFYICIKSLEDEKKDFM